MLIRIAGVILSGFGVALLMFNSTGGALSVLAAAVLGLTFYHNVLKILSTPIVVVEEDENDA